MSALNPSIGNEPASLKSLKARAAQASSDNSGHDALTEEVYKYCLPMRQPSTTSGQAGRVFNAIFDGTGPKAAFRFAGRLQSDFTPPFQKFFELKGGPLIDDGDAKKSMDEDLSDVARIVTSQLNGSNFDVASHEAYLDLFAGQLAVLMLETVDPNNPTHYVAVPSVEIAIRIDGYGRDAGIYWKRKFPIGDLPSMWVSTEIDDDLKKRIDKNPYEEAEVYQCTEFNPTTKQWDFSAFLVDGKSLIHSSSSPYKNWLTTAFYKIPGEAKGRGPGMTALGPIKVANKLQELILKNAAFATYGIWTHRDDGVFRQENSPITPGAMWKVQANGGPFGPSIMRQPMNDRFDVSMLVLSEIQMQIKQATFDDTLPSDSGAVRSATEIIERMKRLAQDWAGAYSRLQREFLRPLIQWNIWIAHKRKVLPAAFKIDEMLISLEIVSPIARGDQASAVENEVKWLELLLSLFGQEAMMLMAKVEEVGPDWGRKLGVSEKLIRSEEDKKAMQQAMAQVLANQQAQQAGEQPSEQSGQLAGQEQQAV